MAQGRKTGGRRKGTSNKATAEAKEVCNRLVDDALYQTTLQRRLRAGKLSPAVECMLWHYAKGKPREELGVEGAVTLAWRESQFERLDAGRKRNAERGEG